MKPHNGIRPGEAGMRVLVGVSGAGKTHTVKRLVFQACAYHPVIVLDGMKEWSEVPGELGSTTAGALDIGQAIARVQEGKRLVIVRPQRGQLATVAEQVCQWAVDANGLVGVAMPEAHNVAPNGKPLPPALQDIATAWRHHKVALWADTQRIALLSRTITENARELRVFATMGDADLDTVRGLAWGRSGSDLFNAVVQCAEKLSACVCPSPNCNAHGYHVVLGIKRLPPFDLVRL